MASKIITGARSVVMVGGLPILYATGVNGGDTLSYDPIRVLNRLAVKEFAAVAYDVSLSFGRVWVLGDSLRQLGVFPKLGKNADDFMNNVLSLPDDMTIAVVDNPTQTLIALLRGAKISSRGWSVDAGQVSGENIGAVGLDMLDESENSAA